MLLLILLKPSADTPEHVIEIWVGKAESKEQKRLLYEISGEGCNERTVSTVISLIVILGQNGFIRMLDIAVHLVNNGITSALRCCELFFGVFRVNALSAEFECFLDEAIIIGRQ